MEKIIKRIHHLKKKKPGYKDMLDFFLRIRKEQEKIKAFLKTDPIQIGEDRKVLLLKEGFPLLQKEDFTLDIEASVSLFMSLFRIGKEANPVMAEQANKIEELLNNNELNLKNLLGNGYNEKEIEKTIDRLELNKKIFFFFIKESIGPSIKAGLDRITVSLDSKTWGENYCPVCGSSPCLSLLKGEVGKRYLCCSFCGFQWRTERLICPFCDNKDRDTLSYFYDKDEQAFHIDLCDKCHQYIKTIDLRAVEGYDLSLEDLATIHLDLLASQEGYKRPVLNLWTP